MALLGPDGLPIDMSKLREEQAAPTLTGVRSILSDHPAQGLTPRRLASLLRQAETGNPTKYLELAEEMEEKDLHYLSVLGTRKRAVSQLEITVEPADDSAGALRHAELVESFVQRDELQDEMVDILDAVGKGYSITEIIWDMSERQWMPLRLEWRDPRWFVFDQADGRTPLLRTETGDEPLAPFKFITHFAKVKSGLPVRGGLARAAAWGYLFKNYGIKDWMAFIEVYGQPLRIGKYHPGAGDEDKAALRRAIANLGTDAAAIIPTGMVIEFVEAQRRPSGDLYESFAKYIDAQISKAVLGQNLTTEVQGGSFAAANVHNDVREDIERSDCVQAGGSLSHGLARPMVDLNFGPQKAYPRIRIGRAEEANVAELSDALAKLVPLGLKVGQREVRQKIGVSEPEGDEELLAPAKPPAEPGPEPALPAEDIERARRAHAAAHTDDDAIDRVISGAIDDEAWLDPMQAVMAPLRELFAEVGSFEELQARLPELIADEDLRAFAERLARTVYAGRLAGEVGAAVNDFEA